MIVFITGTDTDIGKTLVARLQAGYVCILDMIISNPYKR